MADLDLLLRTPGRVLLLERNAAQALLDRVFEERRAHGGLIGRLTGGVGRRRPHAEEDRRIVALPQITWSTDVAEGNGYIVVNGVAVVDVTGVLTPDGFYDWWDDCYYGGYAQIGAAIAAARADDRVRAIFLRINSPGGLTDGCFDLAQAIADGNAKHGGKPIWSSCRMACSAAYALASATDRIVAGAEADVGSIGVYVLSLDFSEYYSEAGIKIEAIQSGARKTDGASWKPLTPDARAKLQGVVDQIARRFFAAVNAGRRLSVDDIAALEGQWFLAQHDDPKQSGLALGLVDQIATEQAAFAALLQSLPSPGPAPTGSGSSATTTARTETSETDMTFAEQLADLRSRAAKGDAAAKAELKKLGISPNAAADDSGDDDDDEDDGDGPKKDEADDEDEDDDEAEPEAKATGHKAGFALLRHKDAKGRTDLANRLGAKVAEGKLTYGEAAEMLGAAPKSRPLGDAMAGRDRNPGPDGGSSATKSASQELAAAVQRRVAAQTPKH